MIRAMTERKNKEDSLSHHSDADCVHGHAGGHGQSGGRGGGHLGGRSRRGVLDVDYRPAGFLHGLYRGHAGPASQAGGSTVWWIPGRPAYYIHHFAEKIRGGKKIRRSVLAVLFAASGLICWCGISQVTSNSVTSAFNNAFQIPPIATTVVLTLLAAVIVLRKNATVKVLDVMVPIMAGCYFVITVVIVLLHINQLPMVFERIFSEAFGLRQAVAGGFGAVLMNGVKRGLFLQ